MRFLGCAPASMRTEMGDGGAVTTILKSCRKTMIVENNYSGQLAKLIRMETGIAMDEKCLKYDGEPFYPGDIVARVKEVI